MKLRDLLRYNTRHHLFLSRERGLLLNPCSYGTRERRGDWHEPLWLFRLRQRTFCFAGRQRCRRRDDLFAFNHNDGKAPDTWDLGPDGNRTCSYCGSLHPDDFMAICRKAITDERYSVDPSDKRYKVYVRQPGVRNASEGAIKFYMQHAPASPTPQDELDYSRAVKISRERFDMKWKARMGRPAGAAL